MLTASLDEIRARIGQPIGSSEWIEVTRERIATFAEATEDRQFIHADSALAAQTPFGGIVAHGFLSLSLLPRMAADAMLVPPTVTMMLNYGLDRLRFPAPVHAGKRVRGHFTLDGVEDKASGRLLFRHSVTVEIEGEDKPALVAAWLVLLLTG